MSRSWLMLTAMLIATPVGLPALAAPFAAPRLLTPALIPD
jgi:hypothetical protein